MEVTYLIVKYCAKKCNKSEIKRVIINVIIAPVIVASI